MKLFGLFALSVVSLFSFGSGEVLAQKMPVLEFYHGAECPHCHDEKKWLPTLQKMFPDLKIEEYEVWHNEENNKKAIARLEALGKKFSVVPTNIIGDQVVVGFGKSDIIRILTEKYGAPKIVAEPVKMAHGTDDKSADSLDMDRDTDITNPGSFKGFMDQYGLFVVLSIIVVAIVGFIFGSKRK